MNARLRLLVGLAGLASAPVISAKAQTPSIKLDPHKMAKVGTIDERFQSYNIEMVEVTGGRFWAPYKTGSDAPAEAPPTSPGAMPASLYRYRQPVDLGDARLRKMAAALGPAYVRVSGTWANSTYFFDADDQAPAKAPAGFNSVLTRSQWRGVVDFAQAANAEIVTSFAISPGVRHANGVWTPAEAEKLLSYTKRLGGRIAAAEMFNEPTFASVGAAPKDYDAAAYGSDFRVFRAYMQKADPSLKILGPGGVGEAASLGGIPGMKTIRSEDLLKQEGGTELDTFSYHFYGGVSQRCARMGAAGMGTSPEAALSHDWLARTERDEGFYAALRDRFTPGKPIWLTETGEAACGGDPWAADFVDSFRYLYQLGTLAKKGVRAVMHNTLDASDYGLIDESTLAPRPNYWSAVLWRRLMGTTVLDAADSHTSNLYLYAHCLRGKPGGVAVLAINADRSSTFDLAVPVASERYTLTAHDLLEPRVELNGQQLNLTTDGDLPALQGAPQGKGIVTLAPTSITFLAIPGAHNPGCR